MEGEGEDRGSALVADPPKGTGPRAATSSKKISTRPASATLAPEGSKLLERRGRRPRREGSDNSQKGYFQLR